jgi:ubiquinone biosynthesis protein UbiJ
MSATATGLQKVCNLLGLAITELQHQLRDKERDIAAARGRLRHAERRTPPDREAIAAAKAEVARFEDEADRLRGQLQGFHEEFSAECRP